MANRINPSPCNTFARRVTIPSPSANGLMADQMPSAHLRWREGLICPTEHVAALTHLSVSLHTTPELAFSPGTACATCTFNSSLIPQMSSSFISKHNKAPPKVSGSEKSSPMRLCFHLCPFVSWPDGRFCQLDYEEKTEQISTKRAWKMGLGPEWTLVTFQCGSGNFNIRFSLTFQG